MRKILQIQQTETLAFKKIWKQFLARQSSAHLEVFGVNSFFTKCTHRTLSWETINNLLAFRRRIITRRVVYALKWSWIDAFPWLERQLYPTSLPDILHVTSSSGEPWCWFSNHPGENCHRPFTRTKNKNYFHCLLCRHSHFKR